MIITLEIPGMIEAIRVPVQVEGVLHAVDPWTGKLIRDKANPVCLE